MITDNLKRFSLLHKTSLYCFAKYPFSLLLNITMVTNIGYKQNIENP